MSCITTNQWVRDTGRREMQCGERKTILASLKYLHYTWKIHHMHLSLHGLTVLEHRRLTWMKVSGNWTKPDIKSFHWTVPGAINWRILLPDYMYLSKYFFFCIPPFWKQAEKKERLVMKMNRAITKSLREFWKGKITTSAVCGFFVKVAEHFPKLGRKD